MLQGARSHGSGARDANKKVPVGGHFLNFLSSGIYRSVSASSILPTIGSSARYVFKSSSKMRVIRDGIRYKNCCTFSGVLFLVPTIYRFCQPSVRSAAPPKSKSPA
jgi:hypothetical protein